jgi:ABC-type multidrug transport system permease subunit
VVDEIHHFTCLYGSVLYSSLIDLFVSIETLVPVLALCLSGEIIWIILHSGHCKLIMKEILVQEAFQYNSLLSTNASTQQHIADIGLNSASH